MVLVEAVCSTGLLSCSLLGEDRAAYELMGMTFVVSVVLLRAMTIKLNLI